MTMKIALFPAKDVGLEIVEIFRERQYPIGALVVSELDSPQIRNAIVRAAKCDNVFLNSELMESLKSGKNPLPAFDIGILAWWPTLIKKNLLDLARIGFLNFHPSLLPHNRGRHPNFWSIVEETPFGVSIHWVDETVDGGDVAFQKEIPKSWVDTGGTLHAKGRAAIVRLFENNFDAIVSGNSPRLKQAPARVRYAKELEPASEIDLDKQYTGRELLNLIRARTFSPYPACSFSEHGEMYEVRVEITTKRPPETK